MSEVQRVRLLGAMAQVVGERGLAATTVAHVVARAGVSRRTFYDLFEDRRECFLAAFDQGILELSSRVLPEYELDGRSWVEQMRRGLQAVLVSLQEEPDLARLCVVQALAGDAVVLERRAQIVRVLANAVDEGRSQGPDRERARAGRKSRDGGIVGAGSPPALTAEGLVGAVLAVIHTRLLESPRPRLTDLFGPLIGMIVLPYLGAEAAQREIDRVAPEMTAPRSLARPETDPLEGLDMRLTYRTLRVLAVIAAWPGASNRDVGVRAEISDQGQMSRLLARLEKLGLIENTGEGHSKGAPNAWRLTRRGSEVQATIASPRHA